MATEELIRVDLQEAKNNRAEYLKSGVLLFAEPIKLQLILTRE